MALAVIALPCLLYSMDLGVLYLALPSLSAALKPSPTQLLWISDIYGFLLAGFLLTMGIVGDRIGRRRLLMIGAAMFGLASVLAAFATSVAMLIVARGLLGIAASTLAPSTLSLIRNMFLDDRQRTVAIGVWVMSFSAGAALGPALGGLLLHFFWWGSVFLIAVPVMALLLVLGPMLLPDPPASRRWRARVSTGSGTCWSGTSSTNRSRERGGRQSTWRPPTGWKPRPASRSRSSRTTRAKRSPSPGQQLMPPSRPR